jgi:hypothetical protein
MDLYGAADRALNVLPSGERRTVVRGNTTTVTYGTTFQGVVTWNNEFYALGLFDRGRQEIHESLHQIQGFSDYVLAGAAHIISTRNNNSPGNRGGFSAGESGVSEASNYLNTQIARHCGGG